MRCRRTRVATSRCFISGLGTHRSSRAVEFDWIDLAGRYSRCMQSVHVRWWLPCWLLRNTGCVERRPHHREDFAITATRLSPQPENDLIRRRYRQVDAQRLHRVVRTRDRSEFVASTTSHSKNSVLRIPRLNHAGRYALRNREMPTTMVWH